MQTSSIQPIKQAGIVGIKYLANCRTSGRYS